MPISSTSSPSEDVKPTLKRASKRKRSPPPEYDDGYPSSPSPAEKKPRVKTEAKGGKPQRGGGGAKSGAWSKTEVRQLWDALDLKPAVSGATSRRDGVSV